MGIVEDVQAEVHESVGGVAAVLAQNYNALSESLGTGSKIEADRRLDAGKKHGVYCLSAAGVRQRIDRRGRGHVFLKESKTRCYESESCRQLQNCIGRHVEWLLDF